VLLHLQPSVTYDDFMRALRAAESVAIAGRPRAMVVDLRDVQRAPSLDEAQRLGEELGRLARRLVGPVVLLASRVVVFGVSRMIAAFAEVQGASVGVFRLPGDAEGWLATETRRAGGDAMRPLGARA
jgi:hypothetical protein